MILSAKIINFPVVERHSGRILGYVEEVICIPGKKQLEGLIYEIRGAFRRRVYLPADKIHVLGNNTIIVEESSTRQHKPKIPEVRQVYWSDGRMIGEINDYLLDERGLIKGLEISQSLVDDIKNGRKIIPNAGNIMLGQERVIVALPREN